MKEKREVYKGRLALAFIISNILFVLILLFSFSISYLNYQGISKQNTLVQQYLEEMDGFLKESTCTDQFLFESSEKLDIVGSHLSTLETRFGKNDKRVIEQKDLYNSLEIKHFELVKKLAKDCGGDFTTILFFYSNEEPYDKESEKIGFVLGTLKNINPQKIMVYSFDYNLNSPQITQLKEKYKIETVPITLINEEDYLRVRNIDDLTKYL
jgi:hypothetical protein